MLTAIVQSDHTMKQNENTIKTGNEKQNSSYSTRAVKAHVHLAYFTFSAVYLPDSIRREDPVSYPTDDSLPNDYKVNKVMLQTKEYSVDSSYSACIIQERGGRLLLFTTTNLVILLRFKIL